MKARTAERLGNLAFLVGLAIMIGIGLAIISFFL